MFLLSEASEDPQAASVLPAAREDRAEQAQPLTGTQRRAIKLSEIVALAQNFLSSLNQPFSDSRLWYAVKERTLLPLAGLIHDQ